MSGYEGQTVRLQPACPRCGGVMQEGFVPEYGEEYDHPRRVAMWIEGKPESSFWMRLKTYGRAQFAIVAYRCVTCGFLEFYASENP